MNRGLAMALAVGCALGAAALPAQAAEDPAGKAARISGGTLDLGLPGVEVYDGVPTSAKAPPSCSIAVKYLETINNGQFDRLADFYADDAVVMPPLKNMRAVGKPAIDRFYREVVSTAKPKIIAVSYVGGPGECFQVHATLKTINGQKRYVLSTVDHFTFNPAGKITRMVAYPRPSSDTYTTLPRPH